MPPHERGAVGRGPAKDICFRGAAAGPFMFGGWAFVRADGNRYATAGRCGDKGVAVGKIAVTTQRREEGVNDVPTAITAATGAALGI
jgi:hypothetical protein